MQDRLSVQYEERTILDAEDKKLCFSFFSGRSLFLGRSRYNYQGPSYAKKQESNNPLKVTNIHFTEDKSLKRSFRKIFSKRLN